MILIFIQTGCVTAQSSGNEFRERDVRRIKAGITTTHELTRLMGEPLYKKIGVDGLEAGSEIWNYGYYKARVWLMPVVPYPFSYFIPNPPSVDALDRAVDVSIREGIVIRCEYRQQHSLTESLNADSKGYTTKPCSD